MEILDLEGIEPVDAPAQGNTTSADGAAGVREAAMERTGRALQVLDAAVPDGGFMPGEHPGALPEVAGPAKRTRQVPHVPPRQSEPIWTPLASATSRRTWFGGTVTSTLLRAK